MKKIFLLLLSVCLATGSIFADTTPAAEESTPAVRSLRIANYNVENLFDAEANQPINEKTGAPADSEFTAKSWRRWTPERYRTKLQRLAWVFCRLRPDICVVEEVENLRVLKELVQEIHRQDASLTLPHIAHIDSSDSRGIDVAVLSKYPVRNVHFLDEPSRRGEIIAEILVDGTVLYVVGNHWKSQIGNAKNNISMRTKEAARLRATMNRILAISPDAAIVACGDYNEDFDGPALQAGLKPAQSREDALASVQTKNKEPKAYNLILDIPEKQRGSYYYARRKVWNTFDQIFVAPKMLLPADQTGPAWRVPEKDSTITFRLPEMEFSEDKRPNSYRRVRATNQKEQYYTNGYADHFPVLTVLTRAAPSATAPEASALLPEKTLPHTASDGVTVAFSEKTLPHTTASEGVTVPFSEKTLPHTTASEDITVAFSEKTLPNATASEGVTVSFPEETKAEKQ